MKSLKKAAKMARLSFENALRLHRDSILLYNNKSFISAYLLSVLAQEEIGKTFLLEEHIFHTSINPLSVNKETQNIMAKALLSHRVKQGWFSRVADEYFKYSRNRVPRVIKEITTGKLEEKKQNATYVGLTKQNNKLDMNGKLTSPTTRVKQDEVTIHITRVNDYIIKLVEECRRGFCMVETYELDSVLTMELVSELEKLWNYKSKDTQKWLEKIRKFEIGE